MLPNLVLMEIDGRVRYRRRSWGILNDMRRLVLLSSLVGVGLAFGLASATAQYGYPPAGYRGAAPGAVIPAVPDDDDDDIPTASPSRIDSV